ncbi:MAG: galactokinase [Flavobacteriaceae bacterium]
MNEPKNNGNKRTWEVFAPGRINLIGEHIDYQGGWVLPGAISLGQWIKATEIDGPSLHVKSPLGTWTYASADQLCASNPQDKPSAFFKGIWSSFQKRHPLSSVGLEIEIRGNLPLGAGLSASASLSAGLGQILHLVHNSPLSEQDLIQIAYETEREFVGTQCGYMDPYAVVKSKADHLLLLNNSDLSTQYIPCDLGPYQLVLFHTKVTHELAHSPYNEKRASVERAWELLKPLIPKDSVVEALPYLPLEVLERHRDKLSPADYPLARFTLDEQLRVEKAVNAINAKDFSALGVLLNQSHQGLSALYQVSCPELDFMADWSQRQPGVLGARMMGGGFGGCTLNLVHQNELSPWAKEALNVYHNKFGLQGEVYPVRLVHGILG